MDFAIPVEVQAHGTDNQPTFDDANISYAQGYSANEADSRGTGYLSAGATAGSSRSKVSSMQVHGTAAPRQTYGRMSPSQADLYGQGTQFAYDHGAMLDDLLVDGQLSDQISGMHVDNQYWDAQQAEAGPSTAPARKKKDESKEDSHMRKHGRKKKRTGGGS